MRTRGQSQDVAIHQVNLGQYFKPGLAIFGGYLGNRTSVAHEVVREERIRWRQFWECAAAIAVWCRIVCGNFMPMIKI